MSGHPEWRGGGGATLQHGNPNSRFHVSKCTDSPGDTPLQIPDSILCKFQTEFPSFQGPSVGPRKDHAFQIPRFHVCRFKDTPPLFPDSRFQVCRFQDTVPQISDSEFPSFRGPLLGPSPRDPQIPDSEFPSFRGPLFALRSKAEGHPNSRFRVSNFPSRPLLGPSQRASLIPDSEFPSFRGASWVQAERGTHIFPFRV